MNIAIIPARGGSKRIPHKNRKAFMGKPLISYSIEVALNSKLFDKIYVSTDDEKIATIAKSYGANILERSKELASDNATTGDVIADAISYLKNKNIKFDFICTIYATAPLLHKKYLKEGYKRLKESNAFMAFSVTSMPFPIWRTFEITSEGRCAMFFPENYSKRSQDLKEAYQDAGQFYWQRVDRESQDIAFGSDSIPVILPRHLVQDIDTEEDWKRAELMYEVLNK